MKKKELELYYRMLKDDFVGDEILFWKLHEKFLRWKDAEKKNK